MRWLVILLLLAGCARRVKVENPVIRHEGYTMTRLEGTNVWAVNATTPAGLERAKRDIGCGVCTDEPVIIHIVEKKP